MNFIFFLMSHRGDKIKLHNYLICWISDFKQEEKKKNDVTRLNKKERNVCLKNTVVVELCTEAISLARIGVHIVHSTLFTMHALQKRSLRNEIGYLVLIHFSLFLVVYTQTTKIVSDENDNCLCPRSTDSLFIGHVAMIGC